MRIFQTVLLCLIILLLVVDMLYVHRPTPTTAITPSSEDNQEVIGKLAELTAALQELKQWVQAINLNVEGLRNQIKHAENAEKSSPVNEQAPSVAFIQGTLEKPVTPPAPQLGWMTTLPASKQQEINQVFADIGRDFPMEDIDPQDPEALHQLMMDQQNALKERLKAILPEQNYEQFVRTLPIPPKME